MGGPPIDVAVALAPPAGVAAVSPLQQQDVGTEARKWPNRGAKRKKLRLGGAVPVPRGLYRDAHGSASLVGGTGRTCAADTAVMGLNAMGIVVSKGDARFVISPEPGEKDCSVEQITRFVLGHGVNISARRSLNYNALGIFKLTVGVFLLEISLFVEDGATEKHFAIYNATTSILKDNQPHIKPLRIVDSDRVDQNAARSAMLSMWPGVTKAVLISVYEFHSVV